MTKEIKSLPKKYQEVLEDKNLAKHAHSNSIKFIKFMIENEKGLDYLLEIIKQYKNNSLQGKLFLDEIMKIFIRKRMFLDEILEIVNSNKIRPLTHSLLFINYRVKDLQHVHPYEIISKGYSLKWLGEKNCPKCLKDDYPSTQKLKEEWSKPYNFYSHLSDIRLRIIKERGEAHKLFVNLHNMVGLREIYSFSPHKRKRFEEVAMIWYDNYTYEEVNNDLAQKFCDALCEIRTRRYRK